MSDSDQSANETTTPSTATTHSDLVPAHQGTLELLDARWDLSSGRTVRFRLVANGHPYITHPFAQFVQRRGGKVGTRFRAAFIRVGEEKPWWAGEVMLAGGGNPLQSGMWVKFWIDDDQMFPNVDELDAKIRGGISTEDLLAWLKYKIVEHPFQGCTSRGRDHPGDLFDAVFLELDDDDNIIDQRMRERVEKLSRDQPKRHLAQYAAMLGMNELFLQYLSEMVRMTDGKTRSVEWWRQRDHVARYIRWICKIESRADLDRNAEAEQRFHRFVREPYANWSSTRED